MVSLIYKHFASVYDRLMKDVPYDEWAQFLHQAIQRYGNGGNRVLDLACGTGEISYRMAELGYELTGVDLSGEMLAVAQEKMMKKGFDALFIEQDMRELKGYKPFDAVLLNCDSINYLLKEEDVVKTFQAVYDHLNRNGLFLFDAHSVHKMEKIFKHAVFADNDEDVSYIWKCFDGEYPNSVIHELTFFVNNGTDYVRLDEDHYQRTFSISEYRYMLEKCGFTIVDITDGIFQSPDIEQAERIFYIAKKS
ncbi:class I SAM-dependent methyltransferase [Aeribacillus composti]|uniref:class I SAM-dependent DNA methyltransferase n=1 Tax=Aeribacillus composti TaxID=1868734 RepID=UPI002E2267C0|nr:class I SAM-dependent methyltransferase [Aeribacillus composti]